MQITQKFTKKFIAVSNQSIFLVAFNAYNLPKLKNMQTKQIQYCHSCDQVSAFEKHQKQ